MVTVCNGFTASLHALGLASVEFLESCRSGRLSLRFFSLTSLGAEYNSPKKVHLVGFYKSKKVEGYLLSY